MGGRVFVRMRRTRSVLETRIANQRVTGATFTLFPTKHAFAASDKQSGENRCAAMCVWQKVQISTRPLEVYHDFTPLSFTLRVAFWTEKKKKKPATWVWHSPRANTVPLDFSGVLLLFLEELECWIDAGWVFVRLHDRKMSEKTEQNESFRHLNKKKKS